jgi:radical SAM protein with 4Fe4S-binding SPASM domain
VRAFAHQVRQACTALSTGRLCLKSDGIPYCFDRLPRKKVFNAMISELSCRFKPLQAWAWPTHLMAEPSTRCNLRCLLCPTTRGLERPQGLMELRIFKKALLESGPYIFTLLLWDWGEPFINPVAYDMIASAKEFGIKVISSTNGHLFAQAEQAEMLVRSGIDTIIFAIDGVTQSTYQHYRQGGDLETALEGLRTVVRLKRKMRSKTPLVNFRFIVTARNEHEIQEVGRLAPKLGSDVLTLKTLDHCLGDPYTGKVPVDETRELAPSNSRYRRFRQTASGQRIRRRRNPCKQFWNNPVIHWNGNVVPCTFDPKDLYVMGNLEQQSLREIWWGERYRQLRSRFKHGWDQLPLCRECSYAYEGGSLNCETMAEIYFYPRTESVVS